MVKKQEETYVEMPGSPVVGDQHMKVDADEKDAGVDESSKGKEKKKDVPLKKMYMFASTSDKIWFFLGAICAAGSGGLYASFGLFFGNALNSFAPVDLNAINDVAIKFLIVAAAMFVAVTVSTYSFKTVSENQMKAIRVECLRKTLHMEMGWYDSLDPAQLAGRIAGDSLKVQEGLGEKLADAIRYTAQFVVAFVVGFSKAWDLTLVMAAATPIILISFVCVIIRMKKDTIRIQAITAQASAIAEEAIAAIRTVFSLNTQEETLAKFDQQEMLVLEASHGLNKFMGVVVGVFVFGIWLTFALGLIYAGQLIKDPTCSYDVGTVFTAFYSVVIGSVGLAQIAPSLSAVATAKGAAIQIFDILGRASEIDAMDTSGAKPSGCQGKIEVDNVHFTYPSRPNKPVLNGYNLTIESGQTVALVGESGSGKSTIVGLLERFYDPKMGSIRLDGTDLRDLNLQWLRGQIGLVSQEPVLFAASVAENIAAGDESISRDQIVKAAKMANAHELISALPEGYETHVAAGGGSLSGGQKQRIAIARALVREPKVLILDEATSALDNKSEVIVQEALNKLMAMKGMSTIVIAHRLSTVRHADRIVVLEKGVVKEDGDHETLMALEDGLYRSFVMRQTSDDVSAEGKDKESSLTKAAAADDAKQLEEALKQGEGKGLRSGLNGLVGDASIYETKEFAKSSIQRVKELVRAERYSYGLLGLIGVLYTGLAWPAFGMLLSECLNVMVTNYTIYHLVSQQKKYLDEIGTETLKYGLIFLGMAVLVWVATAAYTFAFRVIESRLVQRLRHVQLKAILKQRIAFFDEPENRTGALTESLATDATNVVKTAGENEARVLTLVVQFFGSLIISFIFGSWQLTLLMFAAMPILITGQIARSRKYQITKQQEKSTSAGAYASEAIVNVRTVAAFGMEQQMVETYDLFLDGPLKKEHKKAIFESLLAGVQDGFFFVIYAGTFYWGGHLVNSGSITFLEMIRTITVLIMAVQGIGNVSAFMGDGETAKEAAVNIYKLVDRAEKNKDLSEGSVLPTTGDISLTNVDFSYPSRPNTQVLSNYNLDIPAGQTIAFCGPSGCGKSTIVSLLERFYDVQGGDVRVSDKNVEELSTTWLRDEIGMVGQEPVLFTGTIADNIGSGMKNVTKEDIERAAKQANAHNFIMNFPDGYDTQVGLKGAQLSGGQKQRIAIARAIVKDPSILLLDEATSALDSESERIVQKALDDLLAMKKRTTIIIAHRLSTIKNADKIFVMDQGSIIESGTHDELMAKEGLYAHLVSLADN